MSNQEIIKILVKLSGKKSLWDTFSRYIFILDNYLKGHKLSRIESKNHQQNAPRKCMLKLVSDGFNIDLDFNSSLFEDRLCNNSYVSDILFYDRFF